MILYSPGINCSFNKPSSNSISPSFNDTYLPFSSLAILQFWKYFQTVSSSACRTREQFFSVFARTDTNFPLSIYSMERSFGFKRAGIPRVLAIATNKIFFDRKLPVSVFRHPAGVVITLARSLSGTDIMPALINSHIFTGFSLNSFFSSLEKRSFISFLYFCSTSSSTLGFST